MSDVLFILQTITHISIITYYAHINIPARTNAYNELHKNGPFQIQEK